MRRLLALLLMALLVFPQAALTQTTAGGVIPQDNGLRISLSSTLSRPTTAQSGTDLYALPDRHPYISLRTSAGNWELVKKAGTVNVSVGTNYFRIGNVYAYRNSSGKLALEIDWWDSGGQSTSTITNVSAAAECVVTTSAAHGLNVGDRVGIRNGTGTCFTDASRGINNHQFYVKTVGTSTTATLEGADTQSLAYTSGGSLYKIPASATTGQTVTDGVLLKTGDLTRRFVATFQTDGAGNVLDGQSTMRGLSNVDNQELVDMFAQDPADSHTYASGTYRKFNALMVTGQTRLYWTIASPRLVRIFVNSSGVLGNNYNAYAVTKNRDNQGAGASLTAAAGAASVVITQYGFYVTNSSKEWAETQSASTNWVQLWEAIGSGTGTFYGDNGFGVPSADGSYLRVILPR